MPDRVLVGILAFFGLLIVGRWIHEAGLRTLSADEKVAVLDSQAGIRKYSLLLVLPIVWLGYSFPFLGPWLVLGFVTALLGYSYGRLGLSHLPRAYRRAFATYAGLYVLGTLVFFGVIYFGPRS